MKFSIVTVAYNAQTTIRQTIESILSQTYIGEVEYFVIDGKSSDDTVLIAEEYKEKFAAKGYAYSIVSEPDKGIYDAMNKGIKLASGDLIGMVNSDDFYEQDCLENVAKFYAEDPFDIMFADLRIFDDKGSFIKTAKLGKKFKKRHWNHPTMFVAKEVYAEKIYANQTIFDDLDFMLWCLRHNFKIRTLNKVISNFRLGGVSSQKSWQKSMERVKLANQIYNQNEMKGYRLENFLIETIKFLRG